MVVCVVEEEEGGGGGLIDEPSQVQSGSLLVLLVWPCRSSRLTVLGGERRREAAEVGNS